jgi:hypothetical protein
MKSHISVKTLYGNVKPTRDKERKERKDGRKEEKMGGRKDGRKDFLFVILLSPLM